MIGYFSGLGGATLAPGRDVWTAWANSVNKRGGINGHPVQLLIGDDGGNASRSVSIARDFVENKGAIVLSYVGSGLAIADYAKKAGVPVVGTVLGYPGWNSSPELFPPYSAGDGTSWGLARGLRDAGAKKVASLYCAETPDCSDGAKRFREAAAAEGLEVVYQASFSVLQPDFTSECLQMRQRGVEGVYPSGDPASMNRMAQACKRQGLQLIWITPTPTDEVAGLPEFDGAVSVSASFPWFLHSGSQALDEYAAALRSFAPKRLTEGNGLQSGSWVTGKVIEAAGVHLPDKPTKQAMFDALWMLKGEQLGGLAPGRTAITFTRDKATPDPMCMFFGTVKGGKWTAPSPPTPVCR
jgi:branched-chain amino acid transport system substrate-binding protein